jgi:hypothetical protein
MSDAEELARKERRRRLIERLDEKEKLFGLQSPARGTQMSEEELELAAELDKERTPRHSVGWPKAPRSTGR